jgi:hypothetical protein
MSDSSYGVTAYLCPDPWLAPAVEVGGSRPPIEADADTELNACTATVRILHHSSAGIGERTEAVLGLVRPSDDPIACLLCRDRAPRRQDDERRAQLLELINPYRQAGPPECKDGCGSLQLDDRLIRAASAYAIDAVGGQPHDPRLYAQHGGVDYLEAWGTWALVPKPGTDLTITAEDLRAVVDAWLAGGADSRAQILNPSYTRVGIQFLFTFAGLGDPNRGWIVAMILCDLEAQGLEDDLFQDAPPEGWHCNFACVRDVRYHRKRIVEDPLHPEEDILEDFITFAWRTPSLCNLYRIELHGDVRGTRYIIPCDLGACKGDIPASKADAPILGGKELTFDMLDFPPYPGERFEVWGYLQGVASTCSPTLLAAGYFKHFCHTSGVVHRILLVDGQSIVDEETEGGTPEEWIGDERLRYEVLTEGAMLIVIPSDFAGYGCGDRVVIQKGGGHQVLTPVGPVAEAGCKDPKDGTPETQVLRSTIVRPIWSYGGVIRTDGVILPQQFWGI